MQIEIPTFPLSRTAFRAALKTGHGRAARQILQYGVVGLEDLLIEACVTCLSYDPQCEESRAPWLFSLIEHAAMNSKALQAIEALHVTQSPADHWNRVHRSALLKEMAALGSSGAKRLLYSSLAHFLEAGDVIGAEQIIALDGLAGLKHVARQLGRRLQIDPDFWVDDEYIVQVDAATGIPEGLAALEREAMVDPDVARFVAGVRTTSRLRDHEETPSSPTRQSAGEILAYIQGNPKDQGYWLSVWGAKASPDQREIAFAALLASQEPELSKRLLRCFTKVGVPRYDGRLLRWVDDGDEQLQQAAVTALAPLSHVELRRLAKRLFSEGNPADGFKLLVNNFNVSDFAWCTRFLIPLHDADQTHRLVENVLDLCEAQPGEEALGCLLYAYEFSPCSICRRRAVKALAGMELTPAWVLAESVLDADPATRDFARAR